MDYFDSILAAVLRLPEHERMRLIDAIRASMSQDAYSPFSDEWISEIRRRVADLDSGSAETVSWSQIRDEALARVDHGKTG
jgi:putative addiction module component (TIGR02574 family)